MSEMPPALKKILQVLGVNTTRLQWRMHERERNREEGRGGSKLPSWLRWMQYRHKFCPKCRTLVDRNEKTCPACAASLPSPGVYKLIRLIGIALPGNAAATTFIFLGTIISLYLLSVMDEGFSAVMSPSARTLVRYGLQDKYWINNGDYWRFLSFGLFHSGLIHIGFNSMALVNLGPLIENDLGSKRLFVLITISQIAAALTVHFFWHTGAVGASGWIMGLVGFGITFYHRRGGVGRDLRDTMIKWAMYCLILGYVIGFNNAAHLGGLAGGAALGLTADITLARRTVWTRIWEFLVWPCAVLWIATLYFMARSILPIQFSWQ